MQAANPILFIEQFAWHNEIVSVLYEISDLDWALSKSQQYDLKTIALFKIYPKAIPYNNDLKNKK